MVPVVPRARAVARRPTPNELDAFLCVADTAHFARAADQLGVASSTLSETLRRLEAKLGVPLFERSSRRVTITPAGRRLVPLARAAVSGLEAAVTQVHAAPGDGGTFRVGLEGHGFGELNRLIMRELNLRFPHGGLSVVEAIGDGQAIVDADLDVALMRTPVVHPALRVVTVAWEERGLVVPAWHPAAGVSGLDAEEFLDEPFVELLPENPDTRAYWLGAELRGGERPHVGGTARCMSEAVTAVAVHGLLSIGTGSFVRCLPNLPMDFVGVEGLAPEALSVVVPVDHDEEVSDAVIAWIRDVVARQTPLPSGMSLAEMPSAA